MRMLLPLIALFIFLPYDAQLWALGLVRSIPPEFWFGAVGALMMGAIIYALGWDGHVEAKRRQAIERADAEAIKDRIWGAKG